QRQLLVLENQGAKSFFGEPALDFADFLRTDRDGRGIVNVLAADKLIANPRLYATFLLWLLSELFEKLPEVGDPAKPKLVFFFDEAHLLFNDAPKPLLEKIEQVVRLVRSKGVGVYLVTQNPLDVPETVLAQLSNRVQHALRAFTPHDQKAVRAAADTFRPNKNLNTAKAITELGKGEALVSGGQGRTICGRAHHDPPAFGAHRPGNSSRTQGSHRQESGQRQIRYAYRFRICLRNLAKARTEYGGPASVRATRTASSTRTGRWRRIDRPDRRRDWHHFRDQRSTRHAIVDGSAHDARGHALCHQSRGRADRCRPGQIGRRFYGRYDRARHCARHVRRHPAALTLQRADLLKHRQ